MTMTEAEKFDRENDRRYGGEAVLTTKEQKKIIKEREEQQKKRAIDSQNELLQKFTGFVSDPMSYLHSIVSQGEFSSRDQRSQLYQIITLVKIEQNLRELINVLKARK